MDLSEGNLDSPLGRQALKKMYDAPVLRRALKQGLGEPRAAGRLCSQGICRRGAENGENGDEKDAAPDASAYLFAEATEPGAGVAALHDELRACVVSLGVQVGLSPVGLTTARRRRGDGCRHAGRRYDVRRFLNRVLAGS